MNEMRIPRPPSLSAFLKRWSTLFKMAGVTILIQLQDYSPLFGTTGLFVVLAIVIYVTRNIDWYARDQVETASP